MKKKVLIVLCALLVVVLALVILSSRQVRATSDEYARTLAGDNLILQPIGSVNHAITIRRPPQDVWPWLVQMGSGRAGWYAYDFIDNGGHPSGDPTLPGFQKTKPARVFPPPRGVTDVFTVVQYETEHS